MRQCASWHGLSFAEGTAGIGGELPDHESGTILPSRARGCAAAHGSARLHHTEPAARAVCVVRFTAPFRRSVTAQLSIGVAGAHCFAKGASGNHLAASER